MTMVSKVKMVTKVPMVQSQPMVPNETKVTMTNVRNGRTMTMVTKATICMLLLQVETVSIPSHTFLSLPFLIPKLGN